MIIKLIVVACLSWRCDAYIAEDWEPQGGYDVAEALYECHDQRQVILAAKDSLGSHGNVSDVYCDINAR